MVLGQGHEVTIATKPDPDRKTKNFNALTLEELDISGNKVAGYKGKDIFAYQQYLLNSEFDVIINFLNREETIEKSNAGVLLPTRNLEIELGSAIEKRQSIQIFNSITGNREGLRTMRKNGFRIWEDILSWEQIAAEYEKWFKKING